MSYTARVDAARKFGGDKSPYGEDTSSQKGPHAEHPASYPKYSLDNSLSGAQETGFRLYLPGSYLLKTNPGDRDILLPLVNNRYIDLIVSQVQEEASERHEIRRLINGAFATYTYGADPAQLVISGTVLNDWQADWRNQLIRLYYGYISASKLNERGRRVIFSYSDLTVVGEVTGMGMVLTGDGETHGQFTLRVIVQKVAVKINPIQSDYQVKDKPPLAVQTTPIVSTSKQTTTVIRSEDPADVITQCTFNSTEVVRKSVALTSQEATLRASLVAATTRYQTALGAWHGYVNGNPNDVFSAEGRDLKNKVDAQKQDITSIQRALSENASKFKELNTGAVLRDRNTRARVTQTTVPTRVISVASAKKPPTNRNVAQTTQ